MSKLSPHQRAQLDVLILNLEQADPEVFDVVLDWVVARLAEVGSYDRALRNLIGVAQKPVLAISILATAHGHRVDEGFALALKVLLEHARKEVS